MHYQLKIQKSKNLSNQIWFDMNWVDFISENVFEICFYFKVPQWFDVIFVKKHPNVHLFGGKLEQDADMQNPGEELLHY